MQAPDGAQALSLIESSKPDVAVLDVMMPNVDGLTVCRVLRAERNRIPVLMLTARTETPDRVAGLDAGGGGGRHQVLLQRVEGGEQRREHRDEDEEQDETATQPDAQVSRHV